VKKEKISERIYALKLVEELRTWNCMNFRATTSLKS